MRNSCVSIISADREFIELRRRALKRFLALVVRHPVLIEDTIVKYFLTFQGSVSKSFKFGPFVLIAKTDKYDQEATEQTFRNESKICAFCFVVNMVMVFHSWCFPLFKQDMQHKIKEHFRGIPDEFMTSDLALTAKVSSCLHCLLFLLFSVWTIAHVSVWVCILVWMCSDLQELVPMDTQTQFANSKEHLRSLTNSVSKIRDAAEKMVQRTRQYSADMVHIGKELR